MDPPGARSAALLISVYIDTEGGAPWYAQLKAFADPKDPDFLMQRTSDMDQLLVAVRDWLETIIAGV